MLRQARIGRWSALPGSHGRTLAAPLSARPGGRPARRRRARARPRPSAHMSRSAFRFRCQPLRKPFAARSGIGHTPGLGQRRPARSPAPARDRDAVVGLRQLRDALPVFRGRARARRSVSGRRRRAPAAPHRLPPTVALRPWDRVETGASSAASPGRGGTDRSDQRTCWRRRVRLGSLCNGRAGAARAIAQRSDASRSLPRWIDGDQPRPLTAPTTRWTTSARYARLNLGLRSSTRPFLTGSGCSSSSSSSRRSQHRPPDWGTTARFAAGSGRGAGARRHRAPPAGTNVEQIVSVPVAEGLRALPLQQPQVRRRRPVRGDRPVRALPDHAQIAWSDNPATAATGRRGRVR